MTCIGGHTAFQTPYTETIYTLVSILILEEPLKGEGKGHAITGHEGLEE
jgi:hypothetical protein